MHRRISSRPNLVCVRGLAWRAHRERPGILEARCAALSNLPRLPRLAQATMTGLELVVDMRAVGSPPHGSGDPGEGR
jgi:hypothetical protein